MAEFLEIFGDELLSKYGPVSTSEALAGKSGVLVYFSAHWCPPCRGFTPKLAEFHNKHAAAKGFATVFVSGDRDQQSFDDYYAEMPWLALPFGKSEVKAALNRTYNVQGIPFLVVLGPDGKLITKEGRSKVMEDFDDCAGFPWVPKTEATLVGNPSPDDVEGGEPLTVPSQATMARQSAPLACPVTICLVGCCGFWVPLVFWLSAANVLPTCEEDLELFMKVYGLCSILWPTVMISLSFCVAVWVKSIFYILQMMTAVAGCCFTLGLVIWGWYVWANTSDEMCYNGEAELDHYINPRTLTFVFVIFGLLGIGQNFATAINTVKKYRAGDTSAVLS